MYQISTSTLHLGARRHPVKADRMSMAPSLELAVPFLAERSSTSGRRPVELKLPPRSVETSSRRVAPEGRRAAWPL